MSQSAPMHQRENVPTTAAAVANYFLAKAAQESIEMRHLKLQKMVYFAYAWYAGNDCGELFREDIEAWQYGPVIRDLYLQFLECGKSPIRRRAVSYDPEQHRNVEAVVRDQDIREYLDQIWDAYKSRKDSWLVSATHKDDEPWGIYVKDVGRADKRPIPFTLIEEVYRKKVEALDAA